ncbi:MAG: hypothetical protein N4A71_27670 [Carboxylicivirga sp.]|jgi:hypothetical protein|nr:hypothetical protein [Carboxylicivirga sp.]
MTNLHKPNLLSTRLIILLTFVFCSLGVFAASPEDSLDSVRKVSPGVLAMHSDIYWAILLNTMYVFIALPFIFIVYLRLHPMPDHLEIYHLRGEYNAESIIKYIENFEDKFAKKFPNFKQTIKNCGKEAGDEFDNYSEAINNNLFCIKLNGRKRMQVFRDCSNWFLKALVLSLPITGIILLVLSYLFFNLTGLMLSLVPLVLLIPIYLTLLSSILSIFKYLFRITGKEIPVISVAQFALQSITNFNVKRAFDNKKKEYFYYSTIHMYNNDVNADAFKRRHCVDPNPFTINGVIDDYNLQK